MDRAFDAYWYLLVSRVNALDTYAIFLEVSAGVKRLQAAGTVSSLMAENSPISRN